jgi:hypothetical protein
MHSGASGDLTPEKKNQSFRNCDWLENKAGPGMASPVSSGKFVVVMDNNILRAYEAETGKKVQERRLGMLKMVAASPLIVTTRFSFSTKKETPFCSKQAPSFLLLVKARSKILFGQHPQLPTIRSTFAESMVCTAFASNNRLLAPYYFIPFIWRYLEIKLFVELSCFSSGDPSPDGSTDKTSAVRSCPAHPRRSGPVS